MLMTSAAKSFPPLAEEQAAGRFTESTTRQNLSASSDVRTVPTLAGAVVLLQECCGLNEVVASVSVVSGRKQWSRIAPAGHIRQQSEEVRDSESLGKDSWVGGSSMSFQMRVGVQTTASDIRRVQLHPLATYLGRGILVKGDSAYVGFRNGVVAKLELASGSVTWSMRLETAFTKTAQYLSGPDRIAFYGDDKWSYYFDPLWKPQRRGPTAVQ